MIGVITIISKYKYTEKEQKEILNSIVILCDSREQKNTHITDFFDRKNIAWKRMGMKQVDYSFYIPANEDLHIDRDMYFDKEVVLERKNSLEELSSSLSANRTQFENELIRSHDSKFILMVETPIGWTDIINKNYNTSYNNASYLATLFTFSHRHNMDINFIPKDDAGFFIHKQFYYFAREMLK